MHKRTAFGLIKITPTQKKKQKEVTAEKRMYRGEIYWHKKLLTQIRVIYQRNSAVRCVDCSTGQTITVYAKHLMPLFSPKGK